MSIRSLIEKMNSLSALNEGTKETKTGRVHKAEPGGYGRKNDDDEAGKKVKPAVKKGRGRPKKDSDSDTGEVKKWSTDELAQWIVGSKPKTLPGKASVKHKLKDESVTKKSSKKQDVAEDTKETKTGRVHKAEPGGYGRKNDDDEAGKKVKPTIKKGRGRPKKDSDSDTGEVKKWDTDQLASWIVGSKPKTLPGKASVKHKLKDESINESVIPTNLSGWIKHVERNIISENQLTISPMSQQQNSTLKFGNQTLATGTRDEINKLKQSIESGEVQFPGSQQNQIGQNQMKQNTNMQQQPELEEREMSSSERRKEERLKGKYDTSNMKSSMKTQYGPEKGADVYFATIRKQAMSESKKQISEGYTLEDIKQRFPYETKMCQEGWALDEGLYEALRHYYFENGFIPNKVMYGDHENCRNHVLDCYMKDTKPLLGEEEMDEDWNESVNNPVDDDFIPDDPDDDSDTGYDPMDPKHPTWSDRRQDEYDYNRDRLRDMAIDKDVEESFIGSSMGGPEASAMDDIDAQVGKAVGETMNDVVSEEDGEFPFPNEAMYESKQDVAEGKNKKEKSEMKKVKDTQMEAWDRQLHALLNEGMTVTTSTGQNGMGDSVSVSATDEDAQSLMKVLANAGIGMGAGMGAGMNAADSTEGTAIEVEPMAPDEVMGQLQSSDDNGDSDFSFLQRMLSSRNGDEESESKEEESDDEEELDEVSKGQWLKQKDQEAEKSGKKSFKAFGQKFGTDEIDESDEEEEEEEEEEDDEESSGSESEDQSSYESDEEEEDDEDDEESSDEEKVDESQESCNECGCAMTEGHQCSTELNEWANSRGNASKDESFKTELDYMTKLISGGLNGQKRDQTTLPHTKVKAEIVKENLSESISKTMKKLAGIK
jgi:hypothetical protein